MHALTFYRIISQFFALLSDIWSAMSGILFNAMVVSFELSLIIVNGSKVSDEIVRMFFNIQPNRKISA